MPIYKLIMDEIHFYSYNAMMHRIMTDNSKKVTSLKVIKPFDLRRLTDVSNNDSTKW